MLEIVDICKAFGGNAVLCGASLVLQPGDCLGLAGRNGCGKSTLMRIAAQIMRPDSGKILLDGKNVQGDRQFLRKRLGYVPQEDALCDFLTAGQQLRLWRSAVNAADEETAELLELDRLADKPVSRMSGGERKRLSIAMALQSRPDYLLMDEAFSALDAVYRERMSQWISDNCYRGMSVLWCSHNADELERLCAHVCALEEGQIRRIR